MAVLLAEMGYIGDLLGKPDLNLMVFDEVPINVPASQIHPDPQSQAVPELIGSILILLSALCWAIYSIVGKRLLKKYDAFAITTYSFGLGTIFYIPFVVPDIAPTIQKISLNGWMAILYLAIVCSVFGYIGWYYALKKTEASKAAVFLNLIPLFAIIISFSLGEKIAGFFLLGAILIIYGVYLTQKS